MLRTVIAIAAISCTIACDTDVQASSDAVAANLTEAAAPPMLGEPLTAAEANAIEGDSQTLDERMQDALVEVASNEPCPIQGDVLGWTEDEYAVVEAYEPSGALVGTIEAVAAVLGDDDYGTLKGAIYNADDQLIGTITGTASAADIDGGGIGTWSVSRTDDTSGARIVGVWAPLEDGSSTLIGVHTRCDD